MGRSLMVLEPPYHSVPAATWRREDEASRVRPHLGHRRHLGARLGRHVQPVGRGNPWQGRVEVRGCSMWGQRITSHICHFRYTVALFWPVRSAPKVNKSRRIISFFLIGNLVGCDSLFILVLKIRTSYMSEFRHNVIILVLSNFFYLSSKTFQRSKKSTVVKFSQWWIDS